MNFTLVCAKCKETFHESLMHDSHDVPCYLFIDFPNRQSRKQLADKQGRHWLCHKCHKDYEDTLNCLLRGTAKEFSLRYFKEVEDDKSISKV